MTFKKQLFNSCFGYDILLITEKTIWEKACPPLLRFYRQQHSPDNQSTAANDPRAGRQKRNRGKKEKRNV